jgi:hypothetical protein
MVSNVDGRPVGRTEAPDAIDVSGCAEKKRQFDKLEASDDKDADYSEIAQLAADVAACSAEQAAP